MTDPARQQPGVTPEHVALLAEVMGIVITPERLPNATAAFTGYFELEAALDDLTLGDIDPTTDDVSWPGVKS